MTPKQKRLLDFISEYIHLNGYPPSQQEIARHFGFRSLGTVQNYLKRLENEGALQRDWNARRGVRPCRTEIKGSEIPFIGLVAAGKPLETFPIPETLEVPSSMIGKGEHVVLRVKGVSMIGDGILDGDYIVVRRQETAENGQIIVAMIDGEATVKHLQKKEKSIELLPANPAMKPIRVRRGQDFRIEGVVVGVIRHCL